MNLPAEAILLEQSSGILLLVDPASLAILEASKPTCKILGYRRDELLGRPITDIECSLADAHFWKDARQGGPVETRNAEGGYLCASGAILPAIRHVSRVTGRDQDWLVVRGEPIERGKRIEDELASMASLLRATLEATADGILLVDRTGAIVNMNRMFSGMWGIPDRLLDAHDDRAVFSFMAGLFSDPDDYSARLAAISPWDDAETFDLLHLAEGRVFERKSMPARHGTRILGRVFSFTDITARERAEDALRNSEERFRKAVDLSPDSICISRLEDGLCISVNSGFSRTTGFAREDAVGRTFREFSVWDNLQDQIGLIQELRENSLVANLEARFRTRDGQIRYGLTSAALIDIGGVAHVVCITRDITERRLAEADRASLETQLREAQKMEAIGTLAGGVAHDFNNIIAAILGNTELARQDVVDTNPAALESLEEIRKAAQRARNLVQQILSFSRRQPTERKPVALTPVIEESVRLLRTTLPPRLTVTIRCEDNVPRVLADVTQMEQVLLNLAGNAMQAMRNASGHIRIGLDTVMLDAHLADTHPALRALHVRHAGRTVRLSVSDDGPGMDAATLSRIFEPFFTTKSVDEGTGLGLSVVHGIVQTHEGAILVDSAPGRGSTFTLYLPAVQDEAQTQPAAAVPGERAAPEVTMPGAGIGRRVLYLDDDESLVFLVVRLLARRGLRISGHTHQHEALDALRADPAAFDLVVTDYNMPGMSGLDVAREVRAIRAELPVAIASGFIDESLVAQAGEAGVRELIFKANVVEEFCDAVQRLMSAG